LGLARAHSADRSAAGKTLAVSDRGQTGASVLAARPHRDGRERAQPKSSAESMLEMSRLPDANHLRLIGEEGFGRRARIGFGDRVAVLHSHTTQSSARGLPGILWKSHDFAPDAARGR